MLEMVTKRDNRVFEKFNFGEETVNSHSAAQGAIPVCGQRAGRASVVGQLSHARLREAPLRRGH